MQDFSYHILVNSKAGLASHAGQSAIENAIDDSRLSVQSFDFLPPEQLSKKLEEFESSYTPVLIGGGDGTIYQAARKYMKSGTQFGVLPFGTMNMLARDLGVPIELDQMFAAYRKAKTLFIDVGMLNDIPFLCAASLGVMPQASKFREEIREGSELLNSLRVGAFVFDKLDDTNSRKLRIKLDQERKSIRTSAIVISNNTYATPKQNEDYNFRRASLQDGKLGVYLVSPHSVWDRLRLLANLQFGPWKKDPSLTEQSARNITIETDKAQELISIDGEPLEMAMPLNFRILPKALNIIVPVEGKSA